MSHDPRLADQANARAALAAQTTNPADNDFEGMCIQCTERKALTLKLFDGHAPAECNAFCSMDCAELCALEYANRLSGEAYDGLPYCKHGGVDGDFCPKCAEEFLEEAATRLEGGAA